MLKEVLEEIKENHLFTDRMENIQDAFGAHLNGKFTLSIPTLFSQIDGIFIEMHKDFDGKLHLTCPKCGHQKPQPLNAKNISEHLVSKHDPIIKSLMSLEMIYCMEKRRNMQINICQQN